MLHVNIPLNPQDGKSVGLKVQFITNQNANNSPGPNLREQIHCLKFRAFLLFGCLLHLKFTGLQ